MPRARASAMDLPPTVMAGRPPARLRTSPPEAAGARASSPEVNPDDACSPGGAPRALPVGPVTGFSPGVRPAAGEFVGRSRTRPFAGATLDPALRGCAGDGAGKRSARAGDGTTLTCIPTASSTAKTSPISAVDFPPSNAEIQGRDTPAAAPSALWVIPSASRRCRTIFPRTFTLVAIRAASRYAYVFRCRECKRTLTCAQPQGKPHRIPHPGRLDRILEGVRWGRPLPQRPVPFARPRARCGRQAFRDPRVERPRGWRCGGTPWSKRIRSGSRRGGEVRGARSECHTAAPGHRDR